MAHVPGQPYTRVDINPSPEPSLYPSLGLGIWPLIVIIPGVSKVTVAVAATE
jgi:hypothetical protein